MGESAGCKGNFEFSILNWARATSSRQRGSEHSIITKLQSKNKEARSKMTATELLQNDIDMLREHTNAPEESINKLIEMNKEKYGITYT